MSFGSVLSLFDAHNGLWTVIHYLLVVSCRSGVCPSVGVSGVLYHMCIST